ncbi:hypothetical protein TBLA_0C03020 [Henningerozyma blattae CBS 6284]|uniref:Lariat debranching enzyme C-terminal domain-containing protein n=1 Tax=Henningerozyma blattae (strain ATCC 34711 / CBS 6284 / DSM 70876 / NBRC 10599 / NRRL Y-10934 / UCD 77-7) TaxID=1071380 RepID=I2H154_HENB6|nr:hypothetical protein TBLA_0C03020 [Tetrapisispora blattae CBS 6284]CCH60106.1 hypothetical protein TBLA_0C03020 [Tetrapisispora blattae CBS 6284]
MRIAIEGCCHGEMTRVFRQVLKLHRKTPIDLLIILGDFQSIRTPKDLHSMSVPPKFRRMGDFTHYYHDDIPPVQLPFLTLVIGGNHESMRHLLQLPFGGWLCPNVYYMGYSNVIWYKGLRIGGLSGVYYNRDTHTSRPTWQELEEKGWARHVRSLYHVRDVDTGPLFALSSSNELGIDLMLSHDWPTGVTNQEYGDTKGLLRLKPYFAKEVAQGCLGSPINWSLLTHLKPSWWLSAHLHVRYRATIRHAKQDNPEAIDLDLDLEETSPSQDTTTSQDNKKENTNTSLKTEFLALDKCLPGRRWLEVIDIQPRNHKDPRISALDPSRLYVDPEFLWGLRHNQELRTCMDQSLEITQNDNCLSSELCASRAAFVAQKWEHPDTLALPPCTHGIHRRERWQTENFQATFLNPEKEKQDAENKLEKVKEDAELVIKEEIQDASRSDIR